MQPIYLLTDSSVNQNERELVGLYKQLRAVGRVVRNLNPNLGNELDAIGDKLIQTSAQLLTTDALTQIPNTRAIMNRLPAEVSLARRGEDRPLSCIMMDGTGFGRLNNDLGHVLMNQALAEWCQELHQQVRPSDLLARLGGDEVLCLSPSTNTEAALDLAERLSKAAAQFYFNGRSMLLSAGVATLIPSDRTGVDMLARADMALYAAKKEGKGAARTWSLTMGFPLAYEH